jgi:hypothetical protein
MYTLTETLLPILFTGLVAYFVGSIARLLIHILIPEQCK